MAFLPFVFLTLLTVVASDAPNYHGCLSEVAKKMRYCNSSLSNDERVNSLVSSMTLEEKVSRMYSCVPDCDTCPCAVDRVGLPAYAYLLEVNTAVAAVCLEKERCPTTFVGPNGVGASFNRTAWQLKGKVISTEVRAFQNNGGVRGLGKQTGLAAFGPNINIVRDPRFGRNSELPGEDPFLSGTYAVEMTKSMQEVDKAGYPKMIAYLKHFTAYSRETDRGSDDYKISQYDFADTYLPQYEMGMKEGAASGVMCSYNAENGAPSCANGWLLHEVLRKRWGREDAVVTSDGGAVNNLKNPPVRANSTEAAAAMALNNGTDINDGQAYKALPEAIKQGLTTEALVDYSLKRALKQLFWAGLFDPLEKVSWTSVGKEEINSTEHQSINYDSALQSFVLLKNNGVLPLKPGTKIAVVGPQADGRGSLLSDYAGDQQCADGSDNCITSIVEAIRAENKVASLTTTAPGVDINTNKTAGIEAALTLARAADVVVLAVGTDRSIEGEGHDRPDSLLPGLQDAFSQQVLALGKPTVLVMINGGILSIDDLTEKSDAIIEAFNPAFGAGALAAQLFGRENRWGKLPVTIYPASYNEEQDLANYDMTKPPGRTYKYYTGEPLFPFGTGLSLTSFEMKCLAPADESGFGKYRCDLSNTGSMSGDEVVFAFHRPTDAIRAQSDHILPLKRLVAFDRVHVATGASQFVELEITKDMFSSAKSDGSKTIYSGEHELVFWRGSGAEAVFKLTIDSTVIV